MQKLYAQAVYAQAQKPGASAKQLVEKLVKHLKETGRAKLLPSILRELKRIEAKHEKLVPIVEVAHQKDGKKALEEARTHGIEAKEAVVNADLITGWRASV